MKTTFTLEDILTSNWMWDLRFSFFTSFCELSSKQKVQLCFDLAKIVLPIFEKEYPGHSIPRDAIEDVGRWLNGEAYSRSHFVRSFRTAREFGEVLGNYSGENAALACAWACRSAIDFHDKKSTGKHSHLDCAVNAVANYGQHAFGETGWSRSVHEKDRHKHLEASKKYKETFLPKFNEYLMSYV